MEVEEEEEGEDAGGIGVGSDEEEEPDEVAKGEEGSDDMVDGLRETE